MNAWAFIVTDDSINNGEELSNTDIQHVSSSGGSLNAEHYQTFEMAKANDGILGGDDIAQIRSYAAYARAQAQALHKTIAAMNDIDDVTAVKSEALETEQTFAKVGLYADQRVGEILRELPKAKGNQYQQSAEVGTPTKAQAIKQANIDHHTAIDLQAMAANPEVVEAVITQAEKDGRVVSRAQVLRAIEEKKQAERERDLAIKERDETKGLLEDAYIDAETSDLEIESLKEQLANRPAPEVIVREVEVVKETVPEDYEDLKRRVRGLQHDNSVYLDTNKTLRAQLDAKRAELDKANDILGMDENMRDVRRDVQYLTTATNQYIRRYGGLTWTVQQLDEVDDATLDDLRKAVRNLATFSSALVASLEETQ